MSRKNARPAAKKAAAKRKAVMEGRAKPRRKVYGMIETPTNGLAMALVGALMVDRMKKNTPKGFKQ